MFFVCIAIMEHNDNYDSGGVKFNMSMGIFLKDVIVLMGM